MDKKAPTYSVLFVCTANVCRSPLAMGLFQAHIQDEAEDWRVESAGTWALEGDPAASKARQVARERGIDLSSHQARSVTRPMIAGFNLVLTMERGHKEALQIEFPESRGKIYLLSEMVGQRYDIEDPMAGTLADFQATARELEGIFTRGEARIRSLAAGQRDQ